ncbi:MAG TPA: PD-(D/E)XK nuclease family protein [Candidatus Tectomicrobia bacterium]|nr:PD-(D/E)XK nuclease family protein [Candidatus Tectomicrobia bacterium]
MDLHLYPTTLSRDRAMLDATRAYSLLFDHRHFTYAELIERLYRCEGLPGRLIESPAQTVFVRHSLTATLGEAPSPGLVGEYRGAIDELKQAGLAVEDFAYGIDLLDPTVSPITRQALHRLLEVLRSYQSSMAGAGLVDQTDQGLAVLFRLRQHLTDGTKPALLNGVRRIVVHEVYHLSLVYYALVSLLIRLVDEGGMLQHFSSGSNIDAMTFAEFTWQRFVADESLAALVLPEFARPRPRGGNLEALSERLFTNGPGQSIDPDGTFTVVAAPGRAREVEIIARRIRELLGRGVSGEQIAIVVRNLDQYGDLLESICRRYRIPLWFRRGMPLFHVPLTKMVFSLLELADSTYPRTALLKLLTSSYLRLNGTWPDDVVGLVNAVGYLDRAHAPLATLLDAYIRRRQPNEADVQKLSALANWVETLQTMLDGFVGHQAPFSAYLETLKSILIQLGFFRAMGMHPDVPLHVVQRDREAMRLLFDTLWTGAEAMRLLGDAPLAFADFHLLAIDLLREVTLDQPSPTEGSVRVLGIQDTLGLDFDHVFIPGLADTEFPRHYTEHPGLDDRARQALNPAARAVLAKRFAGVLDGRLLGKVLLTTAEKAREEPLLFFVALETANQTCTLSYPTRTANGEVTYASMFVDEVLRHFRETDDQMQLIERPPALPSVPLPTQCLEPGELLRRAAMTWGIADTRGGLTALDEVLRSHGTMLERLRSLASIEGLRKRYLMSPNATVDFDPTPFGDIGRQIDLRRRFLDPQQPWSASMLEDAAACPFAFFSEHILRLAPRAESDYDVSPATLGELAHRILAEFFHSEPPRNVSAAVQHMRAVAGQVLAEHSQHPACGHPGFWHLRQAELLAVLEDLAAYLAVQRPDAYRTRYHECDLTGVVPCGSWSVALKGRLDRVAVREGPSGITGVLVQDFKYSGNIARFRQRLGLESLGRSSFQLPVYLYLTLQRLAQDGYQVPADAELHLQYLLLKDPKRKAWDAEVDRSFFEPAQVGGLAHGVQRIIEQAIAGRFAPRPMEPKLTCSHCTYGALCRYWTSGAGAEAWRDAGEAEAET